MRFESSFTRHYLPIVNALGAQVGDEDPMTEQERNKAVATLYLTKVHTGQVRMEDIYTSDYIHHNEAFYPGLLPGLENFKQALASRSGGVSDVRVRIDHLIAEADKVVARFTLTGKHSGDFQGVRATGREVSFAATDIYRMVDGKIAEGWAMMDFLAFLQQVEAAPQG